MYRVVRGLPQFLSDIRYVVWEGGDGPKERDKKARGRGAGQGFLLHPQRGCWRLFGVQSVPPSLSPLFMLGFILPDTVCRRRVPLAIKGQLLAVRHEILVN